MTLDDGLVHAFRFEADGRVTRLERLADLRPVPEAGAFDWVHFDRAGSATANWLVDESGLDSLVIDALLAEETRPRCNPHGGGAVLSLRGVNLNPGADPEDMVSIRVWLEGHRVITVRRRMLMAVQDVRQEIENGDLPRSAGELVVRLCRGLADRMAPTIANLESHLDELEEVLDEAAGPKIRGDLREFRRKTVLIRRYVAPQREALMRLATFEASWFPEGERRHLLETANDVTRHVESLHNDWERAAILQDEVTSRLSEEANRRLYVLSVIAGVFLPITFVTGLLGINVGGIPGGENPLAFLYVVIGLVAFGIAEFFLFRWLKWI